MATLILRPITGGDAGWDKIDEESPNEDTDYIFQGYAGGVKNFALTDVSQAGTVNWIRVDCRARAERADYKPPIVNRIVTHGTAYQGTGATLTTGYVTRSTTWPTNPYSTTAWIWTEINDLTAGWNRGAGGQQPWYSRVTWLQVVVDFSPPTVNLPEVSTQDASVVGMSEATLNGSLNKTGGANCDCWFEIGETVSYGKSTVKERFSNVGTFAYQIKGLIPSTTYHYRAKAENAGGLANGADKTLTTKPRQIAYKVEHEGRPIRMARGETYRQDTGVLLETQWSDNSGNLLFTDCPNDTAIDLKITWGGKKPIWIRSILEVL